MYYYKHLKPSEITPRALVLNLMSIAGTKQQSIGQLVHSAHLFGIEPSTLRVAVARLVKAGLLESPVRGIYIPGPKSKALTKRLQEWQNVESKTMKWNGDWLVAMTSHLTRTNRKKLRARERTLNLNGYKETDMGFWVRPANLTRCLKKHRTDLIDLGADETILVFRLVEAAMPDSENWQELWSVKALERSYEQSIQAMEESLQRLPTLSPEAAARETLLIGQSVVRTINFDPLLPVELIRGDLFKTMVEMMHQYNDAGVAYWEIYNSTSDAQTKNSK